MNNKKEAPDGMTQQEIADVLGVTRVAVQQMEAKILQKLRQELLKRGIKREDLFEGKK